MPFYVLLKITEGEYPTGNNDSIFISKYPFFCLSPSADLKGTKETISAVLILLKFGESFVLRKAACGCVKEGEAASAACTSDDKGQYKLSPRLGQDRVGDVRWPVGWRRPQQWLCPALGHSGRGQLAERGIAAGSKWVPPALQPVVPRAFSSPG